MLENPPADNWVIVDPTDSLLRWKVAPEMESEDLLVPIFQQGKRLYESPNIHEIRVFAQRNLEFLADGIKRFEHPHRYPSGLEETLHSRKEKMIFDGAQSVSFSDRVFWGRAAIAIWLH